MRPLSSISGDRQAKIRTTRKHGTQIAIMIAKADPMSASLRRRGVKVRPRALQIR
jgi:hypothetical protein